MYRIVVTVTEQGTSPASDALLTKTSIRYVFTKHHSINHVILICRRVVPEISHVGLSANTLMHMEQTRVNGVKHCRVQFLLWTN